MIDGYDQNSTHSTKGTYIKILSQQTEDRRSSEDLITDDNQPNKYNDESINTNSINLSEIESLELKYLLRGFAMLIL